MISLVRYELTLILRDMRSLWTLLVLGLLVLLSFAAGAMEFSRLDAAKAQVGAAERQRWLNQGEKDPHSAAHYSVYAFKPSPILAPLDSGVEPFVGQAVWLEAHAQNDMLHRPRADASPLQRMATLSPATLVIAFGPLAAFLLAFGAVARDRERGTLRLALGMAMHPGLIVGAKFGATLAALVVALVLPVSLASLIYAAARDGIGADVAQRVVCWVLIVIGYLACVTAIGISACLWTQKARSALGILFGVWIVFALVLPRAASTYADAAVPLPSSQTIKETLAREASGYWSAEQGKRQLQDLLKRYKVTRREDLPVDARGAELDLVERHSHQVFDRVLGGFYDQVEQQDRIFSTLGFLSPATAMQSVSPALTGSDFAHHRRFIVHAETYRRDLVNRMNADVMANPLNEGGPRHVNNESLWAQIPAFSHKAPRLSETWGIATPSLYALPLWLIAALFSLVIAARRLKP